MKYIFLLFILFTYYFSTAQVIEIVDYDTLEQKWKNNNDTLYLVNYWATWCKPCVEELPDFIALEKEMENEKFKMILVSLDFSTQIESHLIPFINKNNITTEVVLLKDDPNVWINKVNSNWDGAIPVTQFIKNQDISFYRAELDSIKLKQIIQSYK